jgi:hypothetical protein
MMEATVAREPGPAGTGLGSDRLFSRLGAAAAVTGMLAWVIGVAMIPSDAKLANGGQQLARVLRAHAGQLYAAALLAVLGAVLLAGFFAVLSSLVRPGQPGGVWLRVSLAGCVITQTLVTVGAGWALAAVHAAAGNAAGGLVALAWRGLWLAFLASALPTIVFTAAGVTGLGQAGLSPPWVSALGWLSAAAHLLAMFTLAQGGALAPDGIIATLIPLTTVAWILALAATLPRAWLATRAGQRTSGRRLASQ